MGLQCHSLLTRQLLGLTVSSSHHHDNLNKQTAVLDVDLESDQTVDRPVVAVFLWSTGDEEHLLSLDFSSHYEKISVG